MKKNKKVIIGAACIASSCVIAFGVHEYQKHNSEHTHSHNETTHTTNNEKKINYENKQSTIVVSEITANGYVTIHGDHTHFEKGLVPYNAKILDSLVYKNSNYKLKNEDIEYELAQGYIIKIDNKFYYYPKENVTQTNVVTKEEAEKITSDNHEEENHSNEHNNKEIPGITVKDSDGFILTSENQITSRTNTGIVVSHGNHSHFIPYSSLVGTNWEYLIPSNADLSLNTNSQNYHSHSENHDHDDYVFNPNDIISEDENGYVVRHGDHYHYIPKDKTNYIKPIDNSTSNNNENNIPSKPINNDIENKIPTNKIKFAGIDFATSDNFLFNGTNITKTTDKMFLVNHNGHSHPVLYSELVYSKWEKLIPIKYLLDAKLDYAKFEKEINDKIAYIAQNENIAKENIKLIDTKQGKALQFTKNSEEKIILLKDIKIGAEAEKNYTPEEKEKIAYLAKMLNIKESDIKVVDTPDGKALRYPHGDHTHDILLTEINTNSNENNEIDDETKAKMEYISYAYGVPLEAIKINGDSFVFNTPEHEYDPIHIHPYIVNRHRLKIPVTTGNDEIDFENELTNLAERVGLTPDKIKVVNDKFEIPHGDHNHYIKIISVNGAKLYYENKLPAIAGEYISGELDKEIITNKINNLITVTNEKYHDATEARRIIRELEKLKLEVEKNPSNSTTGYENMLDKFSARYIYKTETTTLTENDKLIQKYNETLTQLNNMNNTLFSRFNFNKEELINKLKENSTNKNVIAKTNHIIDEIKKFEGNNGTHKMNYANYFLQHLESDQISNELREELAFLLTKVSDLTPLYSDEVVPRLIEAKINLNKELQDGNSYIVEYGENYNRLMWDPEMLNTIRSMVEFLSDMFTPLEFPAE